jgi:hypothetical protein
MFALAIVLKHLLPDTAFANYTYLLVMFHLVLAIKVFTADKKAGLALPVPFAILTHLACLALLIGIAVARHQIPFFGLIRYFIPGLAPFEAEWLFNGEKKIARDENASDASHAVTAVSNGSVPAAAAAPAALSLYQKSTGEEYEEFLKMMQAGKRPFRKPGLSVKDEFELWLGARERARAIEEARTTAAANRQTA